MDPLEIATRLGTALLLGGLIGVERQWRQRMAGLRTNALVAIGAAGYVVFSATFSGDSSPTRVAAHFVDFWTARLGRQPALWRGQGGVDSAHADRSRKARIEGRPG